jgi:hypothetical protein
MSICVDALKQLIYASTHPRIYSNGDDRARTDNLRLAKPALSQLSYVPGTRFAKNPNHNSQTTEKMGPGRFELPTSRLSGVRSNQLSYEPIHRVPLSTPISVTALFG